MSGSDKTIYSTNSWKGGSKNSSYRYRYDDEGDEIVKYKEHNYKYFDGDENVRESKDTKVDSWAKDDPSMPDWLKDKI